MDALALVYLALAKWGTYLGLIGLTGAVVARWLLIPPSGGRAASATTVDRTLLLLTVSAGGVAALAAVARLLAQTYSVFGLDEPVTLELVRVIAVESRWGSRWQPQAGVAVLAGVASIAVPWQARLGWRVVVASTVLLWVTLPLTGHAMSWGRFDSHFLWLLQIAHGLAAGLWVGTLIAILVVASPLTLTMTGSLEGHERFAGLIRRFSPLAMAAVATLVVTGGVTAWYYVETLPQLWTTPYGRTLLLKVGLVLATGAVGAYNWRRVTPRLGTEAGSGALRRSVGIEVAVALLLLAATAVLVHLATPYELR